MLSASEHTRRSGGWSDVEGGEESEAEGRAKKRNWIEAEGRGNSRGCGGAGSPHKSGAKSCNDERSDARPQAETRPKAERERSRRRSEENEKIARAKRALELIDERSPWAERRACSDAERPPHVAKPGGSEASALGREARRAPRSERSQRRSERASELKLL